MALPAENGDESSKPKPRGRPFQKGHSGNPGGRPKGLASTVRRVLNEAAEQAGQADGDGAAILASLWIGFVADQKMDPRVRLRASELLAERGWGKAPQFMPIEDDDPLDLSAEALDAAVGEFDATVIRLAARRDKSGDPAANGA